MPEWLSCRGPRSHHSVRALGLSNGWPSAREHDPSVIGLSELKERVFRFQPLAEKRMVSQYEFTSEQNTLIGGLGSKMRFVGLFAVVLGVVNLIIALLAVVAIYQDRVPATWKAKTKEYLEKAREKLPDDVKKQA